MQLTRLGLLIVSMLAATLLPQACGGPTFVVQTYDGPAQPRESIAVIRVRGADPVAVVAVDGSPTGSAVDSDARLHIEVLPGEHSIDVANAELPQQPAQRVWFHTIAGGVYRALWQGGRPRVFLVHAGNDAPLTDVTLSGPSRDAPPLSPRPGAVAPQPELDASLDAGGAAVSVAEPDAAGIDAAPDGAIDGG
jgi:hypothetical protein